MMLLKNYHLVCTFSLLINLQSIGRAEYNMPLLAVEQLAEIFGQTIYETCAQVTALTDLRTDYLLMDPSVRAIDGKKLVGDIKESIEQVLKKKVDAVKKLAKMAESAYKEHIFDKNLMITYPESKKLNTSEFELVKSERFNNILVNFTMSTVHIPTNVYDQSAEVLNGVAWSESLDKVFQQNYETDPMLTWQYFGSTTGFLRMYPGTVWQRDKSNIIKPDVFDCRLQKWYIQAATTPKDIIILLDTSGSMKGFAFDVAKETVKKILDTLTDDDFFNIISFSSTPEYLDPCSNDTLIHAKTANKMRMIRLLDKVKTANLARHDLALQEALEVLSNNTEGAMCNKAIMLITDSLASSYDDLINKYNKPDFQIRIFTYLIGREAKDSKYIRQMACNNKGYFSHIGSVVGVHEKVQDYIHVLSRPLAVATVDHTIWTNVYEDTAGLDLITTVAMPVYADQGSGKNPLLIGVVGTDLPVTEIKDIVNRFLLGVNSYAFAITNNGYIVFHPELKAKHENLLNPNHNMLDLSQLEQSENAQQLRRQMLDRKTDHLHMETRVLYDHSKRAAVRDRHYYFTDIADTPFSLGISLPNRYGRSVADGTRKLSDFDASAFGTSELTIAPWNYCHMNLQERNQSPKEMLIKYLNYGKFNYSIFEKRCNEELIKSLLFDVEATRGVYSSWMKENWVDTGSDLSFIKSDGVELVFIGTKGGLTRYLPLVDKLTDPNFIEKHKSTIDSSYYTRAVDNGEEIFTFSLPFNADKTLILDELLLTASTPIFVNDEGHEAVVAVAGLLMKYTKFYDIFLNSSRPCLPNDVKCQKTCQSDEIDCYLLDYNGYVVLSENSKELGHFYGSLDGSASMLMKELTTNDTTAKKAVFKRIQMNDHQAICEILRKPSSSSVSIYVNPLKQMLASVTWMVHEIVLFVLQFNIFSSLHENFSVVNGNTTSSMLDTTDGMDVYEADAERIDNDSFETLLNDLGKISSVEQSFKWKDECIRKTPTGDSAFMCLRNIKKQYEPGVLGHRPCVKSYTHYVADPMQLPQVGILFKCDLCKKSFSINHVPRTNLMLLAVDSICYCNSGPAMSVKPIEINYNSSEICQKMKEDEYRQRPAQCHTHSPKEDVDSKCGGCSLLQSSIMTILLLQLTLWLHASVLH